MRNDSEVVAEVITSTGHAAVDLAPAAARPLDVAQARGQLWIVAARIADFEPHATGIDDLAHRRSGDAKRCGRGRSASGAPLPDVTLPENPVPLLNLLRSRRGRRRWALFSTLPIPAERIYALAPVTAGSFWEIVADPATGEETRRAPRAAGTMNGFTIALARWRCSEPAHIPSDHQRGNGR